MKSNSKHWNRIFRETADEKLGWHENDPAQTLRLLNQIPDWKASTLFLPGAGTSGLINVLLDAGVVAPKTTSRLERLFRELGRRLKRIAWGWSDKVATKLSKMIMIKQYRPEVWKNIG